MLRKYINLLVFVFLPLFINAQEFTIKKTPEEIQYEKELKEEKEYLKFQHYFFTAIQQKAKEDYTKAMETLEECKQIYPNDVGLNFEFAKNYFKLKDYENAIYFSDKILELKPENIHVLEHLKKIYRAQRDFDRAIEVQHRIIAINPKKKQDLIMLHISNRDRVKAKEIFFALKQSHQVIDNKNYYQRILFPKKPKNTIVDTPIKANTNIVTTNNSIHNLQKQFAKNKEYRTLKKLLLEEEKQSEFEQLAKDSQKGLELFPAQPFLYLMFGKAEIKLLKYNNAIEILNTGLDFIIDDTLQEIAFYKQLNKAYLGLTNHSKAAKYLDKINKLQGN